MSLFGPKRYNILENYASNVARWLAKGIAITGYMSLQEAWFWIDGWVEGRKALKATGATWTSGETNGETGWH